MPVDPVSDSSHARPIENRRQAKSFEEAERRKEERSKEILDEESRRTEDRKRLRDEESRRQDEIEKEIAYEREKGRYIDEVV